MAISLLRQVAILLVVAAALGGWWWLTGERGDSASVPIESRSGSNAPSVIAEPVALKAETVTIETVGTGEAVRAVVVHPSVSGEVVEILFEPGQAVAAGDPLARLDSDEERLAVELATVELDQARKALRRYEELAPAGAISATEVDNARAAVRRAELELEQARLARRERTVRAPFAGVVGIAQVELGTRVTEATAITVLDDRSVILVDFDVPEMHASAVAVGDELAVRPWSRPDVTVTGTVAALASRLDPATRTLRVRARVPNGNDLLRPGMAFAISMTISGHSYPAVPEVAVLWGRDGAYVWRVVDGKAEKVLVRIVRRDGDSILVDGDLRQGDYIVVEGVQRVREGAEVTLAGADVPQASAAPVAPGTDS